MNGRGGVPWGHSIGAHYAFGWCAHCRGYDPATECAAWRGWAAVHVPEIRAAIDRVQGSPGKT